MFEVGRQYRILVDDGGEQSHYSAVVLEVDLPLIKLDRDGSYEILNTAARDAEQLHHKDIIDSISVKYHPGKAPESQV
jgi:hypothetical protein